MPINTQIFKNELSVVKTSAVKADIYEKLSEAGLNPREYRAADHDYTPFLLQIAIDGELQNFLQIVKDNLDLVASVFRVLTPAYMQDLVQKYRNSYGIQQKKLETKMVAIGYIARHTSTELQDEMLAAFDEYEKSRAAVINGENAKITKLQQ